MEKRLRIIEDKIDKIIFVLDIEKKYKDKVKEKEESEELETLFDDI